MRSLVVAVCAVFVGCVVHAGDVTSFSAPDEAKPTETGATPDAASAVDTGPVRAAAPVATSAPTATTPSHSTPSTRVPEVDPGSIADGGFDASDSASYDAALPKAPPVDAAPFAGVDASPPFPALPAHCRWPGDSRCVGYQEFQCFGDAWAATKNQNCCTAPDRFARISTPGQSSQSVDVLQDMVLDRQTGLQWQKYECIDGCTPCAQLPTATGTKWRLPTVEELESIVVQSLSVDGHMPNPVCSPAIDQAVFYDKAMRVRTSGSETVDFATGKRAPLDLNGAQRCVRRAPI